MAVLVFLVLMLAMTGHSSCTWCVCKDGLGDSALQKTLDYACGAGADCNPIHQNGACYLPNTVKAHCSFAVNSYFQKKGQAQGSCEFAGSASISASDPSSPGCIYPSSLSSVGTSTTPTPITTAPPSTTTPSTTTPSTTTPSTTTPSTTTPTTTTPYTATPTGVLGGIGTGVGPSGAGINTDNSHGGFKLQSTSLLCSFMTLVVTGLMLWWS